MCAGPSSFTEVSFPLEHALGGAGWSAAGAFTARAYFDRSGSGAVRLSHVKLERAVLGEDQKLALSALLRDDGLYRVRVPSNALAAADAVAAGNWVAAFLPARCWASLASAKPMAESFILQSDDAGNVLTVELSPPGGSCAPVARAPPVPASFAPTVTVRLPKEAPTLAGLALSAFNADAAEVVEDGPDPGSTAGAAGGGSAPVERTFFQKYGLAIGLLVFNLVRTAPALSAALRFGIAQRR